MDLGFRGRKPVSAQDLAVVRDDDEIISLDYVVLDLAGSYYQTFRDSDADISPGSDKIPHLLQQSAFLYDFNLELFVFVFAHPYSSLFMILERRSQRSICLSAVIL